MSIPALAFKMCMLVISAHVPVFAHSARCFPSSVDEGTLVVRPRRDSEEFLQNVHHVGVLVEEPKRSR